jgi:hypothetical protein
MQPYLVLSINKYFSQIRTDDQLAAGKGPSRDKDTKGLSGGEKSFSTLCLLMSLWDVSGSAPSNHCVQISDPPTSRQLDVQFDA